MKAKQVHDMTDNELEAKLVELKSELFNLRFSHATHQLTNPMQLKSTKRDIARIKTVLSARKAKQA
ncbi:MAG: 50S ribosomal protein L29 [Clostridia bacterium]|nr:50S ribosomal protein L29 [Clostridia bacterium]